MPVINIPMEDKYLERLVNIGSFKLRYIIHRVLKVSSISVVIFILSIQFSDAHFSDFSRPLIYVFLFVILAANSVSEVNLLLVRYLLSFEKIRERIVPQVVILIVVAVSLIALWLKLAMHFFGDEHLLSYKVTQISLLFGVFLLMITHVLVLVSTIAKGWLDSKQELEKLQRAKLLSDYNSLQDRLNPHFLFNNLSVLRSLIRYNPDSAEKFIENFTDVYRYLLRCHENTMVSVRYELEFLNAYIALHKERLGEGLKVIIDVSEDVMDKEIPPMAIQLLVENSIKHNIASRHHPLEIMVKNDGDSALFVSNNINKKETTYSTQTGLKTLMAQYQLIANKELVISDNSLVYKVTIPLL